MFDFISNAFELFAPPQAEPAYEEESSTSGDDYYGTGGAEAEDVMGACGMWTEDNDPFGQCGREEDERMIAHYASLVDLNMIDDSDKVGKAGTLMEDDAITDFTDANSFIDSALDHAGDAPIGNMLLMDHGRPGQQQIGDEWLTSESLADPEMAARFSELGGAFDESGALELHGCQVAAGVAGDQFLRDLSATMNVPVTGSSEYQSPLFSGLEGTTKTCYPPALDETGELQQVCTVDRDPVRDWAWRAYIDLYRDLEHEEMID
jgi:hypothetical protein